MKTVCVYGPSGVGKTLNRELIAEFLDCDTIVDHHCCSRMGDHQALLLKQEAPGPELNCDQVFRFDDIRKFILNHPAYADRWIEPEDTPTVEPLKATVDLASIAKHAADFESRILAAEGTTARPEPEVAVRTFQVGDVVRLKSCCQHMTVADHACGNVIECNWFNGTQLETWHFPPECLEAAPPAHNPMPF
ncbi:YodC family protein [Roseibium album]|uniref:YodC family protein n=1 Tax=Roseibium album TaxID=311410 RepID=UPI00391C56D7